MCGGERACDRRRHAGAGLESTHGDGGGLGTRQQEAHSGSIHGAKGKHPLSELLE